MPAKQWRTFSLAFGKITTRVNCECHDRTQPDQLFGQNLAVSGLKRPSKLRNLEHHSQGRSSGHGQADLFAEDIGKIIGIPSELGKSFHVDI
jgi:hypothetical protein